MTYEDLPAPYLLGAPARYDAWRERQADAVLAAESSTKRFVAIVAPTGFGKSLAYVSTALLAGTRTAIITKTKALQDQLTRDFGEIGLVDVRGMNSYNCKVAKDHGLAPATSCAEGPCHAGMSCRKRDFGCDYYDAVRHAMDAQLVVTNYSYWMHVNANTPNGLGLFDLLILDEAHEAPEAVADFVGVNLDPRDLGNLLDDARTPAEFEPLAAWRLWGQERHAVARATMDQLVLRNQADDSIGLSVPPARLHRVHKLRNIVKKLEAVSRMDGDWVIERREHGFRMEPVWAGKYSEHALFRDTPKIVLYSATLRPKTMALLGVKKESYEFKEYPSSFPLARRPIIHLPTVAVRYTSGDNELRQWLDRIGQVVSGRLDRKGIIHCVSYDRRDLIISNSEFRQFMVWHSRTNTVEAIEKFKRMRPPAILVSPSVTAGWDFPYGECEYQIIAKVPFGDFTSPIAKARDKADPEWSKYVTMLNLVQMTGRGMRADDDQCETFIVDDNISWFVRRNGYFAPKWWRDAFKTGYTIPAPPRRLT